MAARLSVPLFLAQGEGIGVPTEVLVGLGTGGALLLWLLRGLDARSDTRDNITELRRQREEYERLWREERRINARYAAKYGLLPEAERREARREQDPGADDQGDWRWQPPSPPPPTRPSRRGLIERIKGD